MTGAWHRLGAGEFDLAAGQQAAAELSLSGALDVLEHLTAALPALLWVALAVLAAWFTWRQMVALARGRKPTRSARH